MADGVDAMPDVLTSRRPQVDIEYDAREGPLFRTATGPASARQRDQLAANILPDEQGRIVRKTGSSGRSESESSAFDAANTRPFSPPNILCPTT
jgi:hypothetical protein